MKRTFNGLIYSIQSVDNELWRCKAQLSKHLQPTKVKFVTKAQTAGSRKFDNLSKRARSSGIVSDKKARSVCSGIFAPAVMFQFHTICPVFQQFPAAQRPPKRQKQFSTSQQNTTYLCVIEVDVDGFSVANV